MRSLDDIKTLATWALELGALYVKVDDFELTMPADHMPRRRQQDDDIGEHEIEDPAEAERRQRRDMLALLTHSG